MIMVALASAASTCLVFDDIDYSNEECYLSRSATCFEANVYMCYDLFCIYTTCQLIDRISAYRTVVKLQCTAM